MIVLLYGGSLVYNASESYPLGDKLEYVGKVDYGCWVCDSSPASTYYYATDMIPQEVESYFKKATVEHPMDRELADTRIWIMTDKDRSFLIRYYDTSGPTIEKYHLRSTTKRNIISISDEYYRTAKDSL